MDEAAHAAGDESRPSRDERTMAMLCHLAAFAAFVFPFGNILGPLVVWLMKREQYPLVDDQGRESLNFQISLLIYTFVALVLVLVLWGILLLAAVFVFGVVMVIVAAVRANEGVRFRYPLAIRFIRPRS